MLRFIVPTAIATLLFTSPVAAQAGGKIDGIPPGHRPPAGMCRVWIDDVPPGQQAAPTDCATAVRNRPANGRVIFGDDNPKPGKKGWKTSKLRGDDSRIKDRDDDLKSEKSEKSEKAEKAEKAEKDDRDEKVEKIEKDDPEKVKKTKVKKAKVKKESDSKKKKTSEATKNPNDI